MKIATLSGWGQPHDALQHLFPASHPIDYTAHQNPETALHHIAREAAACDLLVGWSLGGQLAVRAAAGLVRSKALVLLAAPFQFVGGPGMPPDTYRKFHGNYVKNPERTLAKAWELVALHDERAEQVRAHLARQDKQRVLSTNWLEWLTALEHFSCETLRLADLPPTLLIHGGKDAVSSPAQSQRFARAIPHSRLIVLPGCGHAPHWHDPEGVRRAIEDFLHA